MNVKLFVHIANVLYLASYLVKDIFLLRLLTIVAMFVFLPYYFFQGNDPLWEPIIWTVIFTGVNVFQLIKLFLERRPVVISAEDQRIYNLSFTNFTIRQFAKLLKTAQRSTKQKNECILDREVITDKVIFVLDGEVVLEDNDRVISTLRPGDFIGDISYITGGPNKYKICTACESKIIFWDKEQFDKIVNDDLELKACWQSLISTKLVEKLVIVNG